LKRLAESTLKRLNDSLKTNRTLNPSKKRVQQKKAMKSVYESDFVKQLINKPIGSKIQKSINIVISESKKKK
jgi:hypothetical protein